MLTEFVVYAYTHGLANKPRQRPRANCVFHDGEEGVHSFPRVVPMILLHPTFSNRLIFVHTEYISLGKTHRECDCLDLDEPVALVFDRSLFPFSSHSTPLESLLHSIDDP